MPLIHNERTKLTATYLNGIAIALFAVGAIAPIVSVLNNGAQGGWPIALLAIICIAVSAALHLMARKILGRLQP